jgi:FtsP/CotA-like multicopper oxidase with cupredoxin domain
MIVARVSNATLFVEGPQIQMHKAPSAPNPNPSVPAANSLGFTSDQSLMPAIPVRRDTWMITPLGYTVIRFVANNPGVWFFHCHMDWHNIAGQFKHSEFKRHVYWRLIHGVDRSGSNIY